MYGLVTLKKYCECSLHTCNGGHYVRGSTLPIVTVYNLGQKVLRILLFLTNRRPTLRIWHHGDPSPHLSLVNVV